MVKYVYLGPLCCPDLISTGIRKRTQFYHHKEKSIHGEDKETHIFNVTESFSEAKK
jgi:hypothetical protein